MAILSTEDEAAAYETFRKLRWPTTKGKPVCPKCGSMDHYEIATRRKFKCAACRAQFSVTSGTVFASRKLSFSQIMRLLAMPDPSSAMEISRELQIQYVAAARLAKIKRGSSVWMA